MTNTKLLEEKIRGSGIKKYVLAQRIGISRQQFAKKCANTAEFKAGEIELLCNQLCINDYDRCKIFFAKQVDY